MTVSHLTRTRDQLWSDLLVALGGSEAYLTRSLSEREVLFEIRDIYGGSVSKLNLAHEDEILVSIVNAAGGSASIRHSRPEMLAALVTALGGAAPDALSSSTGELLAACVNAADTGGGGGADALLLETGDGLLLETGDNLLLDAA